LQKVVLGYWPKDTGRPNSYAFAISESAFGLMLIPQKLTTRFVAICYAFPAIIHRFEAYLTAIDACSRLNLRIGPRLALEALTKDSENSEEHGEEKINFKHGMGK
jgi:hypothetical protein